jgi:hypothetical protein
MKNNTIPAKARFQPNIEKLFRKNDKYKQFTVYLDFFYSA